MDLGAARCGDPTVVAREKARFNKAIEPLLKHDGPKLLVTDSQVGCRWQSAASALVLFQDGESIWRWTQSSKMSQSSVIALIHVVLSECACCNPVQSCSVTVPVASFTPPLLLVLQAAVHAYLVLLPCV